MNTFKLTFRSRPIDLNTEYMKFQCQSRGLDCKKVHDLRPLDQKPSRKKQAPQMGISSVKHRLKDSLVSVPPPKYLINQ
jgi:hypothetical protein